MSHAETRRGFDPDGMSPEQRARKASLFFGGPGPQMMTAQLLVHDLDLRELTSFAVEDAR